MKEEGLLESILERDNLREAYERVKRNRGAAGPDGVTAEQLGEYLKREWPRIKAEILAGTYRPSPVRRVEIPKPEGGVRHLGIPNAVDRFVQQAILQVLTPLFDPGFSENSYGFRPGRSAHQAVSQAKRYIEEGYHVVVDIDIENFFDRVNHDILMSRVYRKVKDKKLLKLIRGYLEAGIMEEGVHVASEEGTPQGSPLSPLLSNILLDELDKELEKRGHKFCRYADDCNIYVQSRKAGIRVMKSITRFLEKRLKLKVNRKKSAVGSPAIRKFLGFTFMILGYGVDICVSRKSIKRLKDRIRKLTNPVWPIPMETRVKILNRYLRGWLGYYALTDSPSFLGGITAWTRRRLRSCIWQQWKKPRTRIRKLIGLGVERDDAFRTALSSNRDWRASRTVAVHKALNNKFWEELGLVNLLPLYSEIRQGW